MDPEPCKELRRRPQQFVVGIVPSSTRVLIVAHVHCNFATLQQSVSAKEGERCKTPRIEGVFRSRPWHSSARKPAVNESHPQRLPCCFPQIDGGMRMFYDHNISKQQKGPLFLSDPLRQPNGQPSAKMPCLGQILPRLSDSVKPTCLVTGLAPASCGRR